MPSDDTRTAPPLLIRNADRVLVGVGEVRPGPADVLVRNGHIAAIAGTVDAEPGIETIDARGHLLAPGLVNAHYHSPMQPSAGTSDRMTHKVFMWQNQVDTAGRSAEEVRLCVPLGALQMLRTGTTAVLDHFPEQGFDLSDVGSAVGAYRDSGMRAVVALRIFDEPYDDILPPPDARSPALVAALAAGDTLVPRPLRETLDLVRGAIAAHDGAAAGRIRIFPAPSNPVRCSDALLTACEEIAREHDTGVHCHLLETRAQAALAEARYGMSVVAHLDRVGAFSGRWSNAHCNWVTEADCEVMARHGAVATLNPESNLKIGSGVPPIPTLLAAGVPCALGTDGASTNDNLVLHEAMSLAAMLHRPGEPDRRRWVTAGNVLAMATTGGARALRTPGLGRVEVGAPADLVLYDLDDPAWVPLNDVEQQLVFSERGGAVRTVIVDGRVALRDGRAVGFDEAAVLREARGMLARAHGRNAATAAVAAAVAAFE